MGKHSAHQKWGRCLLMWLLVFALGLGQMPFGAAAWAMQEEFVEVSMAPAEEVREEEVTRSLPVLLQVEDKEGFSVEAKAGEKALLPEDALLHVDEIPGGDLLRFYVELATTALGENGTPIYGEGYDIYLTSESGQGIVVPSAGEAVTVTVDFGKDPLEAEEEIFVKAFHILQEGASFRAEPLPTKGSLVKKDTSFVLQKLSFEASSFSPFVLLAYVKEGEEEVLSLRDDVLSEDVFSNLEDSLSSDEAGLYSEAVAWEGEEEVLPWEEASLLEEVPEGAPQEAIETPAPYLDSASTFPETPSPAAETLSQNIYPAPTAVPMYVEETVSVAEGFPAEEDLPSLKEEEFAGEDEDVILILEEDPKKEETVSLFEGHLAEEEVPIDDGPVLLVEEEPAEESLAEDGPFLVEEPLLQEEVSLQESPAAVSPTEEAPVEELRPEDIIIYEDEIEDEIEEGLLEETVPLEEGLLEETVALEEPVPEDILKEEEAVVLIEEEPEKEDKLQEEDVAGKKEGDALVEENLLVEEPLEEDLLVEEELVEETPGNKLVEEELVEEELIEDELIEEEPEENLVEEELIEDELIEEEPEENLVEEVPEEALVEEDLFEGAAEEAFDEESILTEEEIVAEEALEDEEAVKEEIVVIEPVGEDTLPASEENQEMVEADNHTIKVRVIDADTKKALSGVKVSLQKKKDEGDDKEEVSSFTSTEEDKSLENLSDAILYTLTITEVPEGYQKEEGKDVSFTLKEDGTFVETDLALEDGVLVLSVPPVAKPRGILRVIKNLEYRTKEDGSDVIYPLSYTPANPYYIGVTENTGEDLDKVTDWKVLPLTIKNSEGEVVFEDLELGKAYLVAEVTGSAGNYHYYDGTAAGATYEPIFGEEDTNPYYELVLKEGDNIAWLKNAYKTIPSGGKKDTVVKISLKLRLQNGSKYYPLYPGDQEYVIGVYSDSGRTQLVKTEKVHFPGPDAPDMTNVFLHGLEGGKTYYLCLVETDEKGENVTPLKDGGDYQIVFGSQTGSTSIAPYAENYTEIDGTILYKKLSENGPALRATFTLEKMNFDEKNNPVLLDDVYVAFYSDKDCKNLVKDIYPENPVHEPIEMAVNFSSAEEARTGKDIYIMEVIKKGDTFERADQDSSFEYDVTYEHDGTEVSAPCKITLKCYAEDEDNPGTQDVKVINIKKGSTPTNTPTVTPRITITPRPVTPTTRPRITVTPTTRPRITITPTTRPRITVTPRVTITSTPRVTVTPTPTVTRRPTVTTAPTTVSLTVTETVVLRTQNGEVNLAPKGASATGSVIGLYRDSKLTDFITSGTIQIRGLGAAASTSAATGQGSVTFRGLVRGQTYYLKQGDSDTARPVTVNEDTNLVELKKTYTSFPEGDTYVAVVPLTLTVKVTDESGAPTSSRYSFRVQLYTKPISELTTQEMLNAALAPATSGSTLGRVSKNAITFSTEALAGGTATETVDVYLTADDVTMENGQVKDISTVLYASEVIRYQEFYYPVTHSEVNSRLGSLGLRVQMETKYPGEAQVANQGTRLSPSGSSTVTVTNVMSGVNPGTSPTPVPTGMQTLTVTETLYLRTTAGLIPLYPRNTPGQQGSTISIYATDARTNAIDTKQILYSTLGTQNATAGTGSVVFLNLAAGQTYYVTSSSEENAIPFTVGTNNNENIIRLSRIVTDIPENSVAKGQLQVTKVLQDANGNLLKDNKNFVVQLYTQNVAEVTANATLASAMASVSTQNALGRVSKNRLVFNTANASEVSETVDVFFNAADEVKGPDGTVTELSTILYVTEVTIAQSSNGESTYYPVTVPSLAQRYPYDVFFNTEYPGSGQVQNNGTRIMAEALSKATVTNRVKASATPNPTQGAANNGTVATNNTPTPLPPNNPNNPAQPLPTQVPPAQITPLPAGQAQGGITTGPLSFIRNIPGIGSLFYGTAGTTATPVRTGDRTPIILYLALLCGAGLAVIVVLLIRRRGLGQRKRKKKRSAGGKRKGASSPGRSSSQRRRSQNRREERRRRYQDDDDDDDDDYDEWRPRR